MRMAERQFEDDIDEFKEMANSLPNLQLLEGGENVEKQAAMPARWIKEKYLSESARTNYCDNHVLGDVPESITEFRDFYDVRLQVLRSRIEDMLAAREVQV